MPNARFGEGTISEEEQTAIVNHIKNRPPRKETLQSTSPRTLEISHNTASDHSQREKDQPSFNSPKSQFKTAGSPGHNESSTHHEIAASVSDSENSDAEDVIEITEAEDDPVQVPVAFEEPKNQV